MRLVAFMARKNRASSNLEDETNRLITGISLPFKYDDLMRQAPSFRSAYMQLGGLSQSTETIR